MISSADAWQLVRRQRLDLADSLADVDSTGWETASMCTGWRVRDVVGHLVGIAEGTLSPHRALPGIIRHRFDVDAFLNHDARANGRAEPRDLLRRLRESAGSRHLPPGRRPADVLADLVVHTQDVLRPLGIVRTAAPQVLLITLSRSVPQGPPLRTRQRAAGLRLRATDIDWSWGNADGAEVNGPAQALLLALTGRASGLADLSGPGAATLAARCTPLARRP